jgi:hypothetical protein
LGAGGRPPQADRPDQIFLKISIILLAIDLNKDYVPHNQLSPAKKPGWFLAEGRIHLSKWHPPVCNIEIYERRMLL